MWPVALGVMSEREARHVFSHLPTDLIELWLTAGEENAVRRGHQ